MIPTPRGPGDLPPPPEDVRPVSRGTDAPPLLLQALDEIDAVKRSLADLVKRVEAMERRLVALESSRT